MEQLRRSRPRPRLQLADGLNLGLTRMAEACTIASLGQHAGTLATIKKNGAQVLEEHSNNGRHVCWVAAPDGAQSYSDSGIHGSRGTWEVSGLGGATP